MATAKLTIGGHAVLIDAGGEVQRWLDRFLPGNTLWQRYHADLHDERVYPKWLEQSLPIPPACGVNEFVWPVVGYSRYAYGLFLVDDHALAEILGDAFRIDGVKLAVPLPGDLLQDKPKASIALELPLGTRVDRVDVFPLRPIAITDSLWLLPVVDARYYRFAITDEVVIDSANANWLPFFNELLVTLQAFSDSNAQAAFAINYPLTVPGYRGGPDPKLTNQIKAPVPLILDVAAFSTGARPVVNLDGTVSIMRPWIAGNNAILANTGRITGSSSGKCLLPETIDFLLRRHDQWKYRPDRPFIYTPAVTSAVNQHGRKYRIRCMYNYHENIVTTSGADQAVSQSSAEEYCNNILQDFREWAASEFDISICDYSNNGQVEAPIGLTGSIDYLHWRFSDPAGSPTLRIKSLPWDWFPKWIVAQDNKTPYKHKVSLEGNTYRVKVTATVSNASGPDYDTMIPGSGEVGIQLGGEYLSGFSFLIRTTVAQLMTDSVPTGRAAVINWCDTPIASLGFGAELGWIIDNYSCD